MKAVRSVSITLTLILSFITIKPAFGDPVTGEAEAGAVVVSGNSDSESYNAKANSTYTQNENVYSASGRYLKTLSNGIESARNWEIGIRYERKLTDYLGIFVGQKAESDIFNGYTQRDSTDIGLKYFLIKTADLNWTAELGDRYQKTLVTTGGSTYDNLGRVYTEVNKSFDKTLSFRYWLEYLPNFTETKAYLFNTEASLNTMLNSIFSLKAAYLLQYQNQPLTGIKYTTTTTTMNLVAKF
ncbi:MAG: DUF481 domain-containing protein [Pseudobdellovibrionaceae bacterium]